MKLMVWQLGIGVRTQLNRYVLKPFCRSLQKGLFIEMNVSQAQCAIVTVEYTVIQTLECG